MFTYCNNNPIMGYDPTGTTHWGGFWAGVGIAAVGLLGATAIIASAGTATPLVAGALTATGTAFGTAVTATGVVTAYGAATEQPIVVDVAVVNGDTHEKHGYSVVVDFTSDSVSLDGYYHYGKTSAGFSASYGVGLVQNYNGPNDYGGSFVDAGMTIAQSGIDYGIDICTGPNKPFTTYTCWAAMATVGVSIPASKNAKPNRYVGYDYYVPMFYLEW